MGCSGLEQLADDVTVHPKINKQTVCISTLQDSALFRHLALAEDSVVNIVQLYRPNTT